MVHNPKHRKQPVRSILKNSKPFDSDTTTDSVLPRFSSMFNNKTRMTGGFVGKQTDTNTTDNLVRQVGGFWGKQNGGDGTSTSELPIKKQVGGFWGKQNGGDGTSTEPRIWKQRGGAVAEPTDVYDTSDFNFDWDDFDSDSDTTDTTTTKSSSSDSDTSSGIDTTTLAAILATQKK